MRRSPILVSAILHLLIMSFLVTSPLLAPSSPKPWPGLEPEPEAEPEVRRRVFLPPPAVVRDALAPTPAPPPPTASRPKDKVSIGPPADRRSDRLVLRREDDLLAQPKGRRDAVPEAEPSQPARPEVLGHAAQGSGGLATTPGLPPVPGTGFGPPPGNGGKAGPTIAESLRSLDRRLGQGGGLPGVEGGVGRQMGPLFFDPEGADFTAWINQFKNEVYRNWIVPQAALLGYAGHVDFQFAVERDGRISDLRLLKSSGTPALDRAAQNALVSSRLLPLPQDFGPPRVTMQVTFFYNQEPMGS